MATKSLKNELSLISSFNVSKGIDTVSELQNCITLKLLATSAWSKRPYFLSSSGLIFDYNLIANMPSDRIAMSLRGRLYYSKEYEALTLNR